MKNLSRMMTLSVLVSGLSLLAACGGAEQDASAGELGRSEAAVVECRVQTRQFNTCVNEANLLGLATCNTNETRGGYSLQGACSTSSTSAPNSYHSITWTCCPLDASAP